VKLGVHIGHWGARPVDAVPLVREAERLGFDSVWTSEAWGSDAVTPLTWIAAQTSRIGVGTAIMQIAARTPAATAMTAITLDHLTGGRFRLGLGMSGPQVVEGWHGSPYGRPLARTREYVEIVRAILRRDAPVEFTGEHYRLPAEDGTGLGKPLRSIVHPLRPDLPIYIAAIGPGNVALAAEIADGWLPILFSPDRARDAFGPSLERGFARGGRAHGSFDVAPIVPVEVGRDVEACRDRVRPFLALYVGGMGARDSNFYNAVVSRYGYEAEAKEIQDLYLQGSPREAAAMVPDALVDEIALVGPAARIRDRLAAWREAGVTTLLAQAKDVDSVRALAEANEDG
jgi:F420-dependent oxidoreductase-like protein